MPIYQCSNTASWHPTMHSKQEHHHPAIAWRKLILAVDPEADQSWWRLIRLCGLCHDEYHTLANDYVRRNGPPPWEELRTYSLFIRRLVAEAWKHRVPERRMPYTTPQAA